MSDKALLSRTSRTGDELAELRINARRQTLAVFDAMAASETTITGVLVSRTEIVNRILDRAAKNKIDEAILITKLAVDNPTVLETH